MDVRKHCTYASINMDKYFKCGNLIYYHYQYLIHIRRPYADMTSLNLYSYIHTEYIYVYIEGTCKSEYWH